MARNLVRRLTLLALVIVTGLYPRHHPVGIFLWDKSLGDASYAAAAFLVFSLCFPMAPPVRIGIAAMLFCIAVECFKLTGLPARWGSSAFSRLLFGTTFSWHNLACYAVAIVIFAGIEWVFVNPSTFSHPRGAERSSQA